MGALLLLALTLIASTSCVPQQSVRPSTSTRASAPRMDSRGAPILPAAEARQVAEDALGRAKGPADLLASAELFLDAGAGDRATAVLAQVPAGGPADLLAWRQILDVRGGLLGEMESRSSLLRLATIEESAPQGTLAIPLTKARIAAYEKANERFPALRQRVQLQAALKDDPSRQTNQATIWGTLGGMKDEEIHAALAKLDPTTRGWAEMSLLQRDRTLTPEERARRLRDWSGRFPNHPAAAFAQSQGQPGQPPAGAAAASTGTGQSTAQALEGGANGPRIALLLPEGGKFSPAAEAIRAGFSSAWARDAGNATRPEIRPYSTSGDKKVEEVYQQAVADGARIVIGPLEKEAVEALARGPDLPVPTLALNHIDTPRIPGNLIQFGLPPEQEAMQIAEHAWLDGRIRAMVLLPASPLGERMFNAFQSRWQQLGGTIARRESFGEKNTPAAAAQKLLTDGGGAPAGDFVFFVATPHQARQIQPALRQAVPTDLPVYATSLAYSGISNPGEDTALDGVVFSDMPWTLEPRDPSLRDELQGRWQERDAPFVRLYGLGIDAYRILAQLDRLRGDRFATYPGETGTLRLDAQGRLYRELLWARFQAGMPRLLPPSGAAR